jgi:hypothetical protein
VMQSVPGAIYGPHRWSEKEPDFGKPASHVEHSPQNRWIVGAASLKRRLAAGYTRDQRDIPTLYAVHIKAQKD